MHEIKLFFRRILLVILSGYLIWSCGTDNSLPQVIIITEFGKIMVEVDTINAPVSATNFWRYADENRFVDASFYRVVTARNQPNDSIRIQVIQGGLGFSENDHRLPSISHETTEITSILHRHGTLSMARNQPGTADSEFFICIGDQPELDYGGMRNPDGQGFAAFGRVVKGMEVVHKIHKQPEEGQMLIVPVKIISVLRDNSR